jgi:hypothetical protein
MIARNHRIGVCEKGFHEGQARGDGVRTAARPLASGWVDQFEKKGGIEASGLETRNTGICRAFRRPPQSERRPLEDGKVTMTILESAYVWRAMAGAAVNTGLAVSIASCGGNGSQAPPPTESPTTSTTTTTTAPPSPGMPPPAPTETPAPIEKTINPTAGNLLTPPVKAPPAPTAIPGNRENTG